MLHVVVPCLKPVSLQPFISEKAPPVCGSSAAIPRPVSLLQVKNADDVMEAGASLDTSSMTYFQQVMKTKRGLHLMLRYSYIIELDAFTVVHMLRGKARRPFSP